MRFVARHIPYIVKIPNSTDPDAENAENAPVGQAKGRSLDIISVSSLVGEAGPSWDTRFAVFACIDSVLGSSYSFLQRKEWFVVPTGGGLHLSSAVPKSLPDRLSSRLGLGLWACRTVAVNQHQHLA